MEFDLSGLIQLLMRQKMIIGAVVAACLLAGIAYLIIADAEIYRRSVRHS